MVRIESDNADVSSVEGADHGKRQFLSNRKSILFDKTLCYKRF